MKKKVLIKMKLGIILTPDARSKAYLQKILKNQIVINEIIFMNDNRSEKTYSEEEENESTNSGFDISESVITTLQNTKTQYKMFNFVDINNHELIRYISSLKLDFIGFSFLQAVTAKLPPLMEFITTSIILKPNSSSKFLILNKE